MNLVEMSDRDPLPAAVAGGFTWSTAESPPATLLKARELPEADRVIDEVLIRPVKAQDAAAEQAFVRALSPASRYLRFHCVLRELPSSMLQAMTEVDQQRHVAYVAHTENGDIVGDARYVQCDGDGREAEFAVVVADAYQGRGIGRKLTERLMERARSDGLRRLIGDVLWDNAPMNSMVFDLGGKLVPSGSNLGMRIAHLQL